MLARGNGGILLEKRFAEQTHEYSEGVGMVFSEGEGRGRNGALEKRFGEKTGIYCTSCLRRYGILFRLFTNEGLEKN